VEFGPAWFFAGMLPFSPWKQAMTNGNTAKENIVRKALLTAALEPAKKTHRVKIKQIDFRPCQKTGLHLHPCPVVGYVVKGSVFFQVEGQPSKTLHAGDAFFEPANARIIHFDNASAIESMTFIAFYLLAGDEHALIRMLD
jgi:quercetin dioxygenase-like cupin family protein